MRVGITETAEVQFGVTGHVIHRQQNRATGMVDRKAGIGDGTVAVRQSLTGVGGPVAVQGFVTVALARGAKWKGGVLLPIGFSLPGSFELGLTPEIDLAANESGSGYHIAWGGVVGLSHALGPQVSLAAEIAAFRDDDPDGRSTDARVAGSLAWQVSDRLQIDIEADAGLAAGAPDHSLAFGLAWQFR